MIQNKSIQIGDKVTCLKKVFGIQEGIVTKIDLWGLTSEFLSIQEHGTIVIRVTKVYNKNNSWPVVGEEEQFPYYGWEDVFKVVP